jgi:prepilin-type N-terminal cleavage/methylation domain-containing protein
MPTCRLPLSFSASASRRSARRAFTLAELLCAVAILTILAGAMATLSYGVGNANDFCRGQNEAAQHARVALERIRRNVLSCKASENFPGCMVASTTVNSYVYPDRLLIWKSDGVTAAATEYPKRSDLIIYTYNPSRPNELLEVTNTNTTALVGNSNAYLNSVVDAILASGTTTKTVITDRLDIATTGGSTSVRLAELLTDNGARGMLRFRIIMSPSATQWSEYKAGTRTWSNIDWPLDQYGSNFGSRRVSCLTELQMLAEDTGEDPAVPFFGSATKVYQLAK